MSFASSSILADKHPALLASTLAGCVHILKLVNLTSGALQPLLKAENTPSLVRPIFCDSGGGAYVAAGSSYGTVKVVRLVSDDSAGSADVSGVMHAAVCNTLAGGHARESEVTALQFSADEVALATGDSLGKVCVWLCNSDESKREV
jgi:hypothetical protein